MADNILKNEFMWQEQQKKKKLYKNWKLYAIALGIIVIGVGTGLGIYYGINANHSEVTKINLSTLDNIISGKESMTEEDAFNAFVSNLKITLEKENVEISDFTAPTYTTEGLVTIKAKENSKKYTGSITLTINAIKQIALSTLNLNSPTIQGIENMKAESAFGIFTHYNPTIAQYVEVGTFIAPTYTTEGSLIINAIKNSKYTGSITIKINAIEQTKLESLNLNTNLIGTEKIQNDETGQEAVNAFLEANSSITDLKNNVEVGTFIAPTYTTEGSLIITAIKDNKYTGSVTIKINAIGQTKLSDLNLDTSPIDGKENMKAEDAFNQFLENNSTITDLKDNIETGTFTIPTYTWEGKLIINATTNGKYTGSITITIKRMPTDLEIRDAIAKNNYQIEITAGTTVEKLSSMINADFIQKQLSSEYQRYFNPTSFKLISLKLNNNKQITDDDLKSPNAILNIRFNYFYYIYSTSASLTIKIV